MKLEVDPDGGEVVVLVLPLHVPDDDGGLADALPPAQDDFEDPFLYILHAEIGLLL